MAALSSATVLLHHVVSCLHCSVFIARKIFSLPIRSYTWVR